MHIYNDCYNKNNKKYDWLIFCDIDEYIYLKNYKSIKLFLNENRFNKCQIINLNVIFYTDNNLIHYDNRSLRERFTEREPRVRGKKRGGKKGIKSIIRGKLYNITINNVHSLYPNDNSCDGFGNKRKINGMFTSISDFEYYYINHYSCKSLEEFIKKLKKTDAFHKKDSRMNRVIHYLTYNKITKEKLDIIENMTKLNLSQFRRK